MVYQPRVGLFLCPGDGHGRLKLAVGQTVACVFTGYRAPPKVGRPTARFLIEDILGADFAVDAFSRRQSESESRRRQVRTGRTTIGLTDIKYTFTHTTVHSTVIVHIRVYLESYFQSHG